MTETYEGGKGTRKGEERKVGNIWNRRVRDMGRGKGGKEEDIREGDKRKRERERYTKEGEDYKGRRKGRSHDKDEIRESSGTGK